ncbi:hypothetical protein [Thermoflexus sp.]|uniref:hypothetical protein n=1 Tax=Thermoflexus sp. TaxID=1969742 RepID=UPI0035E44B51
MWRLALSDRSFPGFPPEAIFEQARRVGIPRLVVHDEILRPGQRRPLWRGRSLEKEEWREVSQWAKALDYSRSRLHAVRFERLRTGIHLVAWAIAPCPPQEAGASRIRQYALTAATAAAFVGAQGLLMEGMDRWEPGEAMAFFRCLLPAFSGLRLILLLRLSEASPLLLEVAREFKARIRPWIALDLEEAIPKDFPALWSMMYPSVSMLMFRCTPEHLEWWDQEGCPILERTGFGGELVVTFPGAAGSEGKMGRNLMRAHRLWLE